MEFALSALKAENLGKDAFTDLLAVSFSSTDYVGHQFGVNSIETQDTYLRLDKDLEKFMQEVESFCGKEKVLFFLTSDHGAVPNPGYLNDHKIPAGYFDSRKLKDSLEKHLEGIYGAGPYIEVIDNDQVFFDKQMIAAKKIDLSVISSQTVPFLINYPEIARAFTADQLNTVSASSGIESLMKNGFNPQRSGDIGFLLQPGYIEYGTKGSTHGSAYTYDTHVPLIFYGSSVRKGVIEKKVHISDIAPTLGLLLGVQPPSGCTGEVIEGVIRFH
jgi:predicted AlkP superfamily pyrophosphatase or phosphodiesterase